jgi:hypothetical protein
MKRRICCTVASRWPSAWSTRSSIVLIAVLSADLGAGRDVAHALAEVAPRDRHGGLLHLPEAAEGEGDEPARREGAREDRDEREGRVDADEVRDRLIHGRQREREQLHVVLACPRDLQDVDGRVEGRLAVGRGDRRSRALHERAVEAERRGRPGLAADGRHRASSVPSGRRPRCRRT